MSIRIAALIVPVLLAVAACDSGPAPTPSPAPPPASPPPASPSAASPSAASLSGACSDSIGTANAVPAGYRLVAGAVAIATDRLLGVAGSGETAPATKLFAKWGLLVKTGETAEITVASGPALVGWGAPATPAPTARITACGQGSNPPGWAAFAGGTWLPEPACVPLTIRAAGQTAEARMPIGAPCG